MVKERKEEKEDEPRLELQQDIERSVSEILALSAPLEPPPQPKAAQPMQARPQRPQQQGSAVPAAPSSTSSAAAAAAAVVPQPSAQQLELLELEMRARAIKALMKANDASKQALGP